MIRLEQLGPSVQLYSKEVRIKRFFGCFLFMLSLVVFPAGAKAQDAFATTRDYVSQFYSLWFTYYQTSFGTGNRLAVPNRISPIYHHVVAINNDTIYASSFLDLSMEPVLLSTVNYSLDGQQSSTRPPVKGMASTVGLYVYPAKAQGATQQLTDESQCYGNAKAQTGFDPNATSTATKGQSHKSGNVGGAAKGAVGGAVISGATGGDAAAGARRGAIVGGIRAKRKEKKDTEQADKQGRRNQNSGAAEAGRFQKGDDCMSERPLVFGSVVRLLGASMTFTVHALGLKKK